jgi:ABC-2 type transport system permease protein
LRRTDNRKMKKIQIIARAELRNLFYSPIAWILLIIFLVLCGVMFDGSTGVFIILKNFQRLNPGMDLPTATVGTMTRPHLGMYPLIIDKLYLFLPLLTMGLISREVNSGTIRLLNSSPVKTWQVVLGKYLAMVIFSSLLVLILGLFAVTDMVIVPFADKGLLISCLLGFFMLLCAYSAIGLFMSCLTSYQVVAAISTLSVFAILNYIDQIGQNIGFVRDLTYYFSLGTRTAKLFTGLITSRDIVYFTAISVMFLFFSFFRLRADQESRKLPQAIARYACVFLIATALIYVTSRPGWIAYADFTAPKTNTAAPVTQALLKSAGGELQITAYVNLLDNYYSLCSPEARNTYLDFWERYVRFKPDIKFKYVYYYDTTASTRQYMAYMYKGKTVQQVAAEFAKNNHVNLKDFLTPEQAQQIPGLHEESGQFVMQLNYNGRSFFLRVFHDPMIWPDEAMIASALKRLINPAAMPKVGILKGDLERTITDWSERNYSNITVGKPIRPSLINRGIDALSIEEGKDIPENITALVLADPKVALSGSTMAILQKYIARGGNLLIAGEPGKQSVLDPLLKTLGVQMKDGTLLQPHDDKEVADLVMPNLTAAAGNLSYDAAGLYNGGYPIVMPGATALDYQPGPAGNPGGFTVQPLVVIDGMKSWLRKGKIVTDSAVVEFNAAAGDEHAKFFATAVGLIRLVGGKQQRIVVTGDADFMSNGRLQLNGVNFSFTTGLFKWLCNGAMPVELSVVPTKDNKAPTDGQRAMANTLFTYLLPGILLLIGTILLIRRNRK